MIFSLISIILSLFVSVISAFSGFLSVNERERRASIIFFGVSLFFALITVCLFLFGNYIPQLVLIIYPALFCIAVLILFIPYSKNYDLYKPKNQIDERLTMFSRAEISNNAELSADFYKEFPNLRSKDGIWRKNPGLGDKKSKYYEPLAFKAAEASFDLIKLNREFVMPPVCDEKIKVSSKELNVFIKNWIEQLGAFDSGSCELQKYHLYSNKGRGASYGQKLELNDKYCYLYSFAYG